MKKLLDVNVHIDDNGNKFDIKIIGGPTKIIYDTTFKVENQFYIQKV